MALEHQRDTELTKFFEMNASGAGSGLRYVDMPERYTFNKKEKKWNPRTEKRKCDVVGRVDNITLALLSSWVPLLLLLVECVPLRHVHIAEATPSPTRIHFEELCQLSVSLMLQSH